MVMHAAVKSAKSRLRSNNQLALSASEGCPEYEAVQHGGWPGSVPVHVKIFACRRTSRSTALPKNLLAGSCPRTFFPLSRRPHRAAPLRGNQIHRHPSCGAPCRCNGAPHRPARWRPRDIPGHRSPAVPRAEALATSSSLSAAAAGMMPGGGRRVVRARSAESDGARSGPRWLEVDGSGLMRPGARRCAAVGRELVDIAECRPVRL
jgi:hypothetical protein